MALDLPLCPQPPPGHRDWYLFEAVRALPRILLMIDKNPLSPTYGSFDREYWHYRTLDFPCGMNQEFCLALAMAWTTQHPANPYHHNDRVRDLVEGSLQFAARSAHRDGSCDDYFPYEKALGATVFSLYAMTESYLILGLENDPLLDFLARRGQWLLDHNETGQLANHQALAALGLANVHRLTGDARFLAGSNQYRDRTLAWQHAEGWFQEYEGADPGYHSCSIDFLAKLRQKTGDAALDTPLARAVTFAAHFIHPDGSYAGEYGSRNTYHFYPHGFELLARETPDALRIVQLYLTHGLPRRTRYFNDDNRMCAHYVYDWFQAWRDYADVPGRAQSSWPAETRTRYFEAAGLLVRQSPSAAVVVAPRKGGVIKITGPAGPVYSDTGPMIQLEDGSVLVTHLMAADNRVERLPDNSGLTVEGRLCRRRAPRMTPLKQIVFRLLSMSLGRIDPNWLRLLIQKLFITGKPTTPSTFRRTIRLSHDRVEITDHITLRNPPAPPRAVLATPDSTSIYVANSNTYQASNLLPVRRLESLLAGLRQSGTGEERHVVFLDAPRPPPPATTDPAKAPAP